MELRSCYFCGSAGRTLSTRELVPDGDGAEPVDVVLCPDCDGKLDRLLSRILDRPAEGSDADAPAGSGGTDPETEGFDFPSEITFDDGDGATGDDPGTGDAAADADDSTEGEGSTEETDDAGGVDVIGRSTAAGEKGLRSVGTTSDGDDAADDEDTADDDAADDEDTADDDAADDDGGAATGGDGVDAVGDDGDAADADAGGSGGRLRGLGESPASTYRKALRLLRNREFPMAREDLVDVLSSAYDLDYDECQRLVDLAVEQGILVEDGDELRRG
ncbi:MAG: hypothetical protein ABEJ34_00765 [Haloferacaceae archaeon]